MPENKQNRDPEITRRAIKDALLSLLEKKSFGEITVSELSRAARINRVTFYSHYENIRNLMAEIETDLADQIIESMQSLFKCEHFHELTSNLFLDAFLSNPQIGVWFMGEQTTGAGAKRIYEYSKALCIREWKKRKGTNDDELERFFDYYYAGAMAYLKNWYQSGLDKDQEKKRREFTNITGYVAQYVLK